MPSDAASDPNQPTIRADLSDPGHKRAPSSAAADPTIKANLSEPGVEGNTTRTIRADMRYADKDPQAAVAKKDHARVGLPPGGIPGYDVSRRLGSGGMGQVYEAVREETGIAIALKLLRADAIADPEFRDRFQREAAVMREVNHMNVVGYVDSGEHEGWLYIATQLMRDGDLDRYLKRRGQLFEKDALTLILKASEGIQAIHEAGLVHRDIKPQNIFLDQKATDGGDVKVGDLGMARHESGEDRMTMTGTACGTPAYMSPEQLRGEADIDHRADTYALGVMLFTLLAGREPFIGDTAFTVSHAVLKEQPPDLRRFAPDVSAAAAAIVRQAIRKNRDERYQSANDFIVDCRRALNGERPLHAGMAEIAIATNTPAGGVNTVPTSGGANVVGRTLGGMSDAMSGMGPMVKLALIGIVIVGGLSAIPSMMDKVNAKKNTGQSNLKSSGLVRDNFGTATAVVANNMQFDLRWVPPGSYEQGAHPDDNEQIFWETQRSVTLTKGFWMLGNEISNQQYQAIIPSATGDSRLQPATNISRLQAEAFCTTLSSQLGVKVRLPSEAEWEYACRAQSSRSFSVDPKTITVASDPDVLNSWRTQPVDSHVNETTLMDAYDKAQRKGLRPKDTTGGQPNAWGLSDMHGNIQEWCLDRWNNRDSWSSEPVLDPIEHEGPLTVVRGGSWMHPGMHARSSAREAMDGELGWPWIGFRFIIEGNLAPEVLPTE